MATSAGVPNVLRRNGFPSHLGFWGSHTHTGLKWGPAPPSTSPNTRDCFTPEVATGKSAPPLMLHPFQTPKPTPKGSSSFVAGNSITARGGLWGIHAPSKICWFFLLVVRCQQFCDTVMCSQITQNLLLKSNMSRTKDNKKDRKLFPPPPAPAPIQNCTEPAPTVINPCEYDNCTNKNELFFLCLAMDWPEIGWGRELDLGATHRTYMRTRTSAACCGFAWYLQLIACTQERTPKLLPRTWRLTS